MTPTTGTAIAPIIEDTATDHAADRAAIEAIVADVETVVNTKVRAARAVQADGTPIDVGHAMVALYVLVKERGRWWIVARQNTLAAH